MPGNTEEPIQPHPVVRWRQDQLEEAIQRDLATIRIADDKRREWVKDSLARRCRDQVFVREEQNRVARKRLTEIEQMQQRLLDGYLAGGVDKDVFTAKSTELKIEAERLRERLADAKVPGAEFGQKVLEAFEFAQNAAARWGVSGTDARRAILGRVLLKRSLSDVSLVTTKRRPFDFLAERPFLKKSRGECTQDQTAINVDDTGLRPALQAFAEELAQPVLQIPFVDDLTSYAPCIGLE